MLDCELYGLNPMGHHWTNVQLHIANTLLLFFILFKMTGALWRSAFVTALFALHPLHVESVAWVSERKDVLSTFFGLLMIFAYYRYVKTPDFKNYILVFVLLCFGLMAKPMLVTFPFILLLLDFWPLKRCQIKNDRVTESDGIICFDFQRFFQLILEKIPFFIPVVISCVLTFFAQQSSGAVKSLESFSLKVRIANAFVSYTGYVVKAIWPGKLAVFYPHPGDTLPAWQIFGAALLIAFVCFWAIRTAMKYPYIIIGLFWYLGTLVPVIGLVQVGEQAMADRYTYIPLIGLFIIVAWGVLDFLKKWHNHTIIFILSAISAICVLAVCTFLQLGYWQNGITLFEHAVSVTENNYQAHNNLGTAYGPADLDKAAFHYKAALKIKPEFAMAHYNLGIIYTKKSKTDDAIYNYLEAVRIDPNYLEARINLGTALFNKENYDEAVLHFKKALKMDPRKTYARMKLAKMLFVQGKSDEAVSHYKEILKTDSKNDDVHYNLGNILINEGKTKEAFIHFAETIRINPDYAEAYNKIGLILAEQGKFKKAGVFFSRALQLDPGFSEARTNLDILRNSRMSK